MSAQLKQNREKRMKINAELMVERRKERFWSQRELAAASGLHLRTKQRIEKEASGMFSIAKLLPVVCVECGYIWLFASEEARKTVETSKHLVQV
jgi:hypothetical protein